MLSLKKFSHYSFNAILDNQKVLVNRYSYESLNCIYDIDIFDTGFIRYIKNGRDTDKDYIHDSIIKNYNLDSIPLCEDKNVI